MFNVAMIHTVRGGGLGVWGGGAHVQGGVHAHGETGRSLVMNLTCEQRKCHPIIR